jgi:hypothetical protein
MTILWREKLGLIRRSVVRRFSAASKCFIFVITNRLQPVSPLPSSYLMTAQANSVSEDTKDLLS